MSELAQRRKAMAEEMMRDAICAAATTVLAEVGYTALTMERVAEAAGTSKGTLYNYFQDKDALVVEVIERAFAPIRAGIEQALARPVSPRQRLTEIVRLVVTGVEDCRALGQALCTSELSARVDASLRARQLVVRQHFTEVLRQAQAAGGLRGTCGSLEQMGRFLALVIGGVVDERMLYGNECPPVDQDVSAIEHLVLQLWFKEDCR